MGAHCSSLLVPPEGSSFSQYDTQFFPSLGAWSWRGGEKEGGDVTCERRKKGSVCMKVEGVKEESV